MGGSQCLLIVYAHCVSVTVAIVDEMYSFRILFSQLISSSISVTVSA